MKTIARFTPRPSNDAKTDCDLILGKVLSQSELIKPNHVYEIVDFFGTLIIKDLGESSMGMGVKDCTLTDTCWCQEAGNIITDGSHLYTKEEAFKIVESRKNIG